MRKESQLSEEENHDKTEVSEPAVEKIKSFFELSKSEERDLADRIERFGGLIRIFVHPYYVLPNERQSSSVKKELLSIDKAMRIMASLEPEKVPPVLFMEESEKISEFKQRFFAPDGSANFLGDINNDIYIIPTVRNGALPQFDDKKISYTKEEKEKNWEKMTKCLKTLGVKKVLIGGMFLSFFDKSEGKELQPDGCVGEAINHLEEDFSVQLSNLTFSTQGGTEAYERKRKTLKQILKEK